MILNIFFQFGFPTLLLRKVSGETSKSEIRTVVTRAYYSITVLFITSTILMLSLNYATGFIENNILLLICFLAYFTSLITVNDYLCRAHGKVILGQCFEQNLRPLLLLLLFILYLKFFEDFSWLTALRLYLFVSIVVFIASYLATPNVVFLGPSLKKIWKKIQYKEASPFLFISSILVINNYVDINVIKLTLDDYSVGLYRVASQIADIMNVVMFSISGVIGTLMVKLIKLGQKEKLNNILKNSHRLSAIIACVFVVIIYMTIDYVIEYFYGVEYREAIDVLYVLVVGKLLYSMICFYGLVLVLNEYAKLQLIILTIFVFINFLLSIVASSLIGITGVALVTSFCLVAMNFIFYCFYILKVKNV